MGNEILKHEDNCPNCNVDLLEDANFCPNCGQRNYSHKIKITHILGDFISDYFSFDSKFFRSIIPLLLKPGRLTNEFSVGKRVKYIHPIRLYLFASFISLFLFTLNGDLKKDDLNIGNDIGISFKADDQEIKYGSIEEFRDVVEYKGIEHYLDSVGVDEYLEKMMVTQLYRISKSDSKSVGAYFTKNASILMFFLMPIFAFLLYMFFRKSQFYYVEHLMHSIHIHSFIFLFFSLFSLISFFAKIDAVFLVMVLIITGYTIKSLKVVYTRNYRTTIAKFLLLITLYNVVILIGFVTTLFISLALF